MAIESNAKPLRAILWCAVSSESQAEEGKESLPAQERDLRALAQREGWDIVDVLIVPGFSRRYYELSEFADAAQREKIDAGKRLQDHLQKRDFDVFACHDGSRFGRTQALLSGIVERVIDIDAKLYTLADGWIDERNYCMYASMGGYSAASHVDFIQRAYQIGMPKRVSRGLPVGQPPITHYVERNGSGKAVRLLIIEDRRRLFEDATRLLLQGVGWGDMPITLYKQFGHANPKNGKPYSPTTFRTIFYGAWTWEHSARLYTHGKRKYGDDTVRKYYGLWAFDEDEPLPPGVEIYRNTCPPVFTGDLAEQVKAELRRRAKILEGRAGHKNANMFTGLLVCGSCGCRMGYRKDIWCSYRCGSSDAVHKYQPRHACTLEKRTIGEKMVVAWFQQRLCDMLERQDPLILQASGEMLNDSGRVDRLYTEIADVEGRIASLLMQRADTPSGSQHILSDLINRFDQQLQGLRLALGETESQVKLTRKRAGSTHNAYEEIRANSLDTFWNLPIGEINRILLMLLGDNRLVVMDGEIVGIAKQTRVTDIV